MNESQKLRGMMAAVDESDDYTNGSHDDEERDGLLAAINAERNPSLRNQLVRAYRESFESDPGEQLSQRQPDFIDAARAHFGNQKRGGDFIDAARHYFSQPIESAKIDEKKTQPGTAKDLLYGMAKGAGQVVQAAGWLTGSDTIEELGRNATDYWADKQSDKVKGQLTAVEQADGFWNTLVALKDNPSAFADMVVGSLPMMVPGMAVGSLGARGIAAFAGNAARNAAIKAGAAEAVANQAGALAARKSIEAGGAKWFAMASNVLGEGAVSGGSAGSDVEKFALEHGATESEAKDAAKWAALKAGASTALVAGIGAKFETEALLGKLTDKGFAGAAKNIGKEALEEGLQNPAEEYFGYEGRAKFDPNQKYDFGGSLATGLATGGMMGGIIHAAGRSANILAGEQQDPIADIGKATTTDDAIAAATEAINIPLPETGILPRDAAPGGLDISSVSRNNQFAIETDQLIRQGQSRESDINELEALINDETADVNMRRDALMALQTQKREALDGAFRSDLLALPSPSDPTGTLRVTPEGAAIPETREQRLEAMRALLRSKYRLAGDVDERGVNGIPRQEVAQVAPASSGGQSNIHQGSVPAVLAQPASSGMDAPTPGTVAGSKENSPAATAIDGGPGAVAQPANTLETPAGQQIANIEHGDLDIQNLITGGRVRGALSSSFSDIHQVGREDALKYWNTNRQNLGASGGQRPASVPNGPGMEGSKTNTQWKLAFHQELNRIAKVTPANEYANPATVQPESPAPGADIQPTAQPVAPAAHSKRKSPNFTGSLINDIKQLGGVSQAEFADITGETSIANVKGAGFVFRKDGQRLDDLVTRLNEIGYNINANDVDGGVQQLRDMLRDALDGNAVLTPAAQERAAAESEQKAHKDTVLGQAKEAGIRTTARKFSEIEKDVITWLAKKQAADEAKLDAQSAEAFASAKAELAELLDDAEVSDMLDALAERFDGKGIRAFYDAAAKEMTERAQRIKEARSTPEKDLFGEDHGTQEVLAGNAGKAGQTDAAGTREGDEAAGPVAGTGGDQAQGGYGFALTGETESEIARREHAAVLANNSEAAEQAAVRRAADKAAEEQRRKDNATNGNAADAFSMTATEPVSKAKQKQLDKAKAKTELDGQTDLLSQQSAANSTYPLSKTREDANEKWRLVGQGRADPDADQRKLMDAVDAARKTGITSYDRSVDHVIQSLKGYLPDGLVTGDGSPIKTEVIGAWHTLDMQAGKKANAEAKARLNLRVGQKIGNITPNTGKMLRAVHVEEVGDSHYTLIGTAGNKAARISLDPVSLERAIKRAQPDNKLPAEAMQSTEPDLLSAKDDNKSAIESIKQSDDIPTADKIRLAAELRNGDVTAEDVAAIVGDVSPNQENVSTAVESVDAHDKFFDHVRDGDVTAQEFKSAFASFLQSADAITAELSALTKTEIFKRFPGLEYRYKNEKKDATVKAAYRSMLDDFVLGDSISWSHGEKYEDVIQGYVDHTTDESIKQYADIVRKAKESREQQSREMQAGMDSPQTADDFKNLLAVRARDMGEGVTFQQVRMTLTPEQRARFDELEASRTRESRKARADQQKTDVRVAAQTAEGQVIETKHTKTGEPLFVVKAADRVERDIYNHWNATAKRMGGWYSSFRGSGAVPGFQFKTRENADAFLKFIGGDAAQAQEAVQARRDAYADDKSQSAVERLNEMADALEEKADASLSQDRKANTARRARFAASAEAAANSDKAMAQTMRNIAKAIENGTAKFLDRVRQKVQVEMLSGFVRTAQYDMHRKMYETYAEQEKHKGEKPTAEVADYATFPNYTAFRSDLASLGRALLETEGTKKLGQRLMKVADDVSGAYLKFAKDNIDKVSAFRAKDGSRAAFPSKAMAELSIQRSGYKGAAIVLPVKRNENLIVLSPSEAIKRGVWEGDNDKRITLSGDFGVELVEAIGKASRRGAKVSVPWQFENAYDKRKRLAAMGIETPAELRAALREFIGLKEAPKEADKIKEMERAMIGRRNDGLDFFPTPSATADEMIETAGIKEGMSVLEPSAGMGHIAERIREVGVDPDVVELSNERKELLEAKGFNVVGRDFMDTEGSYDRIIMNPPFSDGRAAQHVQHAYDLLKPGGRLVALVDEGVFFRGDKKAQAFRDWLEQVGATDEKLEEGTFNDPSLPVNTGVNARMLVIDKPETDQGTALFSQSAAPATNPHTQSTLTRAIDAAFGKGFTGRLIGTGKFRFITSDKLGDALSGAKFSKAEFRAPEVRDSQGRLLAPNGEVSKLNERQWHQVRSPEFKNWFGDWENATANASKVVDPVTGEPMVVYHGTSHEFSEFDDDMRGTASRGAEAESSWFFAENKEHAEYWAQNSESATSGKKKVLEVFLIARNPAIVNFDEMTDREQQYPLETALDEVRNNDGDGALVKNMPDDESMTPRNTWMVFDSNQIKSATDNTGTFDPSNPDIRYSKDGRILAFVKDGITHFVYDNISSTDDNVKGLLLHEIGDHALTLGRSEPEFQAILKQFTLMGKAGNEKVKAAQARVPKDTPAHLVEEESLGYFLEANPDLTFSQKVIAWFKSQLRKIGKTMPVLQRMKWNQWANTLTTDDIVYMAQQALKGAPQTLGQAMDRGTFKAENEDKQNSLDTTGQSSEDGGNNAWRKEYGLGQKILGLRIVRLGFPGIGHDNGRGVSLVPEWATEGLFAQERGADGDRTGGTEKTARAEQAELIAAAKKNGFFFEDDHQFLRAVTAHKESGGTEHDAYFVGEMPNVVVIRSTAKSGFGLTSPDSPAQYLKRLAEYNATFPLLQIRVVGVSMGKNGVPVIWTAQSFVPGQFFKNHDLLFKALADKGWEKIAGGPFRFRHKETGAVIDDAHFRNVLHIGDKLYPIDVIVKETPKTDSVIRFSRAANARNGKPFNIADETSTEKFVRTWQDNVNHWQSVQKQIKAQGGSVDVYEDVYAAMKRYPGRVGELITDFTRNSVDPLLERMARLGTNMEEIGTYLYALHAKDRNAYIQSIRDDMPDNGSGLDNGEAQMILDDYRNNHPKFAEFDKLARDFQALTNKKLEMLVREGVITQDQADSMKAAMGNHYVPLKGFERIDEQGSRAQGNGSGTGYSTNRRLDKRAYGRVSRAGNIVENIVRDYERAILAAEKANVGRYLKNLVEANPDNTLWTIDRTPQQPVMGKNGVHFMPKQFDAENEVQFIENGKPIRIQLHDPLLASTYNNLGTEQLNSVLRMSGTLNAYLRQMWTSKNPVFFLINPIRDIQTSLVINTGQKGASFAGKALRNLVGALKASYAYERNDTNGLSKEWRDLLKVYGNTGARTGAAFIDSIESKTLKLQESLNRHGGNSVINEWRQYGAKNALKLAVFKTFNNKLFDVIEHINGGFENMTRLATFKAYVDSQGGLASLTGQRRAEVLAEAARLAKNVTVDFNTHGEQGRNANALYLFFNANVQGTANIGKAIATAPHRKQVWAAIGGMVLLGFALSLMGDDDDESLTPEHIKQRNLVFTLNGTRYQVPMPYGFSFFADLGRLMGDVAMGRKDTMKASLYSASSFLANFSPLGDPAKGGEGDSADLVLSLVPTVLKPPVMVGMNRGPFGNQLMPEYPGQENSPDRGKMWRSTRGSVYDTIANDMMPWADVSPETLKTYWQYITGGAGRFVVDGFGAAMNAADGEFDIEKTPIASKFVSLNDIEEYRQRFYEQIKEVKEAKRQAKLGEPVKNRRIIALSSGLSIVQERMRNLADKAHEARTSGDREDAKRYEDMQIAIAKRFNERYRLAAH